MRSFECDGSLDRAVGALFVVLALLLFLLVDSVVDFVSRGVGPRCGMQPPGSLQITRTMARLLEGRMPRSRQTKPEKSDTNARREIGMPRRHRSRVALVLGLRRGFTLGVGDLALVEYVLEHQTRLEREDTARVEEDFLAGLRVSALAGTTKFPKPEILTFSPSASVSLTISKTFSTSSAASFLENPTRS